MARLRFTALYVFTILALAGLNATVFEVALESTVHSSAHSTHSHHHDHHAGHEHSHRHDDSNEEHSHGFKCCKYLVVTNRALEDVRANLVELVQHVSLFVFAGIDFDYLTRIVPPATGPPNFVFLRQFSSHLATPNSPPVRA